MLSRVLGWWTNPTGPINLAVFRIVLFSTVLLWVDPWLPAHFAVYPAALCYPPGVWSSWISWWPVTEWAVWSAYCVFVPASVLAIIGLWTRVSTALATLSAFYLLSVPQFFGMVNHYHHLVWFTLILMVSPCGDAVSVDEWRAKRRAVRLLPHASPSAAYTLPLRCVTVLIGLLYLFPGLWKILKTSGEWASGANMVGVLHTSWAQKGGWIPAIRVDEWPWLMAIAAPATLALELGFLPAIVAHRWSRRLWMIGGLGFHLSVYIAMRIYMFWTLVMCYAAMIDWEGLVRRLQRRDGVVTEGAGVGRGHAAWPAALVGGLLIVGNAWDGWERKSDWPLACYPTFDYVGTGRLDLLRLRVTMADGSTQVLTDQMLGAYSRIERGYTLYSKMLWKRPDAAKRMDGLWLLWTRLDPTLLGAKRVEFVKKTIDTKPGRYDEALAEIVVYTIEVATPAR